MTSTEPRIVCPTCLQTTLAPVTDPRLEQSLWCSTCSAVFPVFHSVPHLIDVRMLQQLPLDLLAAWHITQQRSLPLYQTKSVDSVSLPTREDVQTFRDFMDLAGKEVLDIGSGAYSLPGYIVDKNYAHYTGLDPLPVTAPPPFPLLVGLAEQLPFPDNSFDAVILATSLDHVLHTHSALSEIVRVLKPTGEVYFWGGLVESPPSFREIGRHPLLRRTLKTQHSLEESIQVYLQMEQQYRAVLDVFDNSSEPYEHLFVDYFHFRHFSRADLIGAFRQVGMMLSNERPILVNDVVASVAMRFVFSPYPVDDIRPTTELQLKAVQDQLSELQTQVNGLNEHIQTLSSQLAVTETPPEKISLRDVLRRMRF